MWIFSLICFHAIVELASARGEVGLEPSPLPGLLISGTSTNGTSMIVRIDGFPQTWMEIFREHHTLDYSYITGNDPTQTAFKALACHHENNMVFWSNPLQGDIEWMPNFILGEVAISDVHHIASEHVNGMAADWLSHNLYWTDTQEKKIMLSAVNDPHLAQGSSPYHKRILDSSNGLSEPWDIAVDPFEGKIYWTDADRGTVNSANLDGSNIAVIYQGSGSPTVPKARPTAIVVDVEEKILYWIDENLMAIISVHVSGQGLDHLHDFGNEEHGITLKGLAMYEDYLFTTGTGTAGQRDSAILYITNRHRLHDNLRIVLSGPPLGLVTLHDIVVLAPQLQPPEDQDPVCEHSSVARCPHICLGYQNDYRSSCICADDYHLVDFLQCQWDWHVTRKATPEAKPTPTPSPSPPPHWSTTRAPQWTTARGHTINPLLLTPGPRASSQGGIHPSVVTIIAVVVAGLVIITVIIAILVCFVLKHRQKQSRAAAPSPPTVVFTQQSNPGADGGVSNPMYGAGGASERPPSYLCATGGAGVENPYENLDTVMVVGSDGVFPGDVPLDGKEEKV